MSSFLTVVARSRILPVQIRIQFIGVGSLVGTTGGSLVRVKLRLRAMLLQLPLSQIAILRSRWMNRSLDVCTGINSKW